MEKVRWGIVGTARIATVRVIPAAQRSRNAEVTAIASRQKERAEATARQLGIAKAYGSYEQLLADPEIDAVYIPLPNDQHVPWSIKALDAGKHVLCEKPIALTADEALTLLDAATRHPQQKIMEAFMYRFHPQWQRTKELVASGAVGELRTMQSFFSYTNLDPDNIRNQVEHGGGGLMDIGCYNISYSRFIFDEEPLRVCGTTEFDPAFKTDRLVSGILDFGRGTASFTCSTQIAAYQRVNILGTNGRIEIETPVNAPADRQCRVWHQHDATVDELLFGPTNQFTREIEAFSDAIIHDGAVPFPLEDAVANMRVIDAVVRSSHERAWVSLAPATAA